MTIDRLLHSMGRFAGEQRVGAKASDDSGFAGVEDIGELSGDRVVHAGSRGRAGLAG